MMSKLLAQLGGVGEEVFLGFQIPEAVMGFAEAVELGIDRVGLAFLPEIGDGGQRHLHVGVDELLAAFDRREVQCGLRDDVQAADVGHKTGRVEAFAHHPEGFFHVLGVAAAGAYHVGGSVVDIVEVERSLEIGASRAGEEIQAAILSEDVVSLLDNRGNRSHHDDLIVAGSAGNLTQHIDRILDSAGVHIAEIDATGSGELLGLEHRGTVKTGLINVRHNEKGRPSVLTAEHIVDHRKSHRADTGQKSHLATVLDFHLVHV